jgi:tRNA modification GTPase
VRTLEEIGRADVVLHIVDAAAPNSDRDVLARVSEHQGPGVPLLTVVNKIDLSGMAARSEGDTVWLSALRGNGIDLLRDRLHRLAGWEHAAMARRYFWRASGVGARGALKSICTLPPGTRPRVRRSDLFAEELRLAQLELSQITGEFSADDLLGVIFSRFCIGK